MYDFSGGKGWNEYVVDKKGNLATSITQQVQLDVKSIANFNRLLGDKTSFGGAEASCFTPHLGLVYYRKDKIIAYITICLDCNVLISSLPLDAQKQGKVGVGKEAYYTAGGPSQSFRLFLNNLLRKYKFSHQLRI